MWSDVGVLDVSEVEDLSAAGSGSPPVSEPAGGGMCDLGFLVRFISVSQSGDFARRIEPSTGVNVGAFPTWGPTGFRCSRALEPSALTLRVNVMHVISPSVWFSRLVANYMEG